MATDAVWGDDQASLQDGTPSGSGGERPRRGAARLKRELLAQQQTVERIAHGEPLQEILTELCCHVEGRYPGSLCTILTLDRSAGVLRHSASPSLPREFAEQIDELPVGEGMGACGTAAARGVTVTVDDLLADPLTASFVDLARRFDLRSTWSYPMLTPTGQVLGTFALYRHKRHRPSDDEIRFVANTANLAALAIDRARSDAALQAAADLDSLTGLSNRARFLELANHELQHQDRCLGLMFLEVDRFPQINESLGYLAGDQLLIEVAHRVKAVVGEAGTVSRFGVDVFTVMVPAAEPQALQQLADRVLQEVSRPLELDGVELLLTVSIGIATGGHQTDAFSLVRDADAAMRAARTEGPGHRQLYDRKLRVQLVARLRTENELRRAIERRELVMHYQPILNVGGWCWSGVEALVRWQHPKRGLVGPDGFIPLAEETGLIVPLGESVFEMVFEQARRWASVLPEIQVAVNASVMQLAHPSVAETIERMLAEAGLDPRILILEVTESALMERVDSTRAALDRLVADGVSVLIDDFGTGYSSLARLGELPISGLKIDRRFVKGLGSEPRVRPIVKAISDLARAYGLEVVVEGIEDADALAAVMGLGCQYAQGYHLGRPAAAEVVVQQLVEPVPEMVAIA